MTANLPAGAATIKRGTLAPEGSPWHEMLRDMAEGWKAASDGKVTLRIYAGGVAGDEPDMVRKMRIGQLHAAALTGSGLSRIAPEIQALQMPMMFRSDAELDYVRERIGPKIEAILEAKGFKLLTWGDAGWAHFFTTKPVVTPDDLRPLRLFMWGSTGPYLDAWKDEGYNPVPVPAPEIHTALTTGMIDAIVVPPIAALSFQWFGIANHMTDMPWAPMVGAIVISERSWRKIPKNLRARFLDISIAASAEAQAKFRAVGPQAIEAMEAYGLTVHQVPPEALEQWRKAVDADRKSTRLNSSH